MLSQNPCRHRRRKIVSHIWANNSVSVKKRKCHVGFQDFRLQARSQLSTWCFVTPFTNKHSWWHHHWRRCTQKVVLFLVSVGISSTLSFLFKSPLLSGICKPKKQTHCPSGRLVRDQAWDFPGLFPEVFVTISGKFSGQFSGRHSWTPSTTNKEVWIFLTVFRTTFRSIFRSTSRRISRHLPGQFPEGFPDPRATWSRIIEAVGEWQAKGCCRNAIDPHKPNLGTPCCTCKNLPQFEETLTICWSCPGPGRVLGYHRACRIWGKIRHTFRKKIVTPMGRVLLRFQTGVSRSHFGTSPQDRHENTTDVPKHPNLLTSQPYFSKQVGTQTQTPLSLGSVICRGLLLKGNQKRQASNLPANPVHSCSVARWFSGKTTTGRPCFRHRHPSAQ